MSVKVMIKKWWRRKRRIKIYFMHLWMKNYCFIIHETPMLHNLSSYNSYWNMLYFSSSFLQDRCHCWLFWGQFCVNGTLNKYYCVLRRFDDFFIFFLNCELKKGESKSSIISNHTCSTLFDVAKLPK